MPEPNDDERRAIVAALRDGERASAYASAWRRSALDDLRDDALPEEPGSDTRIVEP